MAIYIIKEKAMKRLSILALATGMILGMSAAQWIPQPSPTSGSFYDVQFLDAQTGWVVGSEVVLRTTDGGVTWIQQDLPRFHLLGIQMFDANKGVAVGYTGTSEWQSEHALIIRSTDGGITWLVVDSTQTGYYESVFFLDSQNGWTVGSMPWRDSTGLVLKSTNGGVDWDRVDSGKVWDLKDVWFVSPATGWAAGYYGEIYMTVDGGLNWQLSTKATNGSFDAPLRSVRFATPDSGWVVGGLSGHQVIGRTTNGGVSWQFDFLLQGTTLNDVFFLDSNTGWAVGGTSAAYKIVHTGDAGITWEVQGHGLGDQNTAYMEAIFMIDRDQGWIVGRSGTILNTNNGGITGIEQSDRPTPSDFYVLQNYPNPFNPSTTISFELPRKVITTLDVYNILGRHIETIVSDELPAGSHTIEWRPAGIPSGIYFVRLQAGDAVLTRKVVLLR